MDKYGLTPDPCDNRFIRFNNFIQLLACICKIAAMISQNDAIEQIAQILDIIAQLVFHTIAACMQTQTNVEVVPLPPPEIEPIASPKPEENFPVVYHLHFLPNVQLDFRKETNFTDVAAPGGKPMER
jgi:hypothetical protein